jgi:hypothetical protein
MAIETAHVTKRVTNTVVRTAAFSKMIAIHTTSNIKPSRNRNTPRRYLYID